MPSGQSIQHQLVLQRRDLHAGRLTILGWRSTTSCSSWWTIVDEGIRVPRSVSWNVCPSPCTDFNQFLNVRFSGHLL